MLKNKLISVLGSPDYRANLITNWQSTDDIVQAIKTQHVKNRAEAKKICKYFDAGNVKDTARNIFNFLKTETTYEREPTSKQTTKTIRRFLTDGKGDCKHYSLFINNILEACGYKSNYRFASYDGNGFTHVYSYIPKTDTVVDAVLTSFDTEKKPTNKKDMSLYSLSGLEPEGDEVTGVNFSKITSNLKKAQAKSSSVVKKAVKSIPQATKKLAQASKTVSLAPARVSFVGLVKLNGLGLATQLSKLYTSKGREGLDWWQKIGGNRDELIKAIQDGAKKKALLSGIEEESESYNEIFKGYSGDGVSDIGAVGIATAIASATPILLQVKSVLAKAGIKTDDLSKINTAVKKGTENFKKLTGKSVTDVIFKKDAGSSSKQSTYSSDDLQPTETKDAQKVVEGAVANATGTDISTIKNMAIDTPSLDKAVDTPKGSGLLPNLQIPKGQQKLLLIGGAVLVLFFVLRKKS